MTFNPVRDLRVLLVAVVLGATWTAPARAAGEEDAARRLISLVEYIGGDYTEAVRQGKVVNEAEYKEMHDFAASAAREYAKLSGRLSKDAQGEVQGNLTALKLLIEQKADVAAVRALTKAVKDRIIDGMAVNTTPPARPDRALALANYAKHCATCHGAEGRGDGPTAKGQEPPPRNFHEDGVMEVSSPFKFYNTLVLGVEGTTMVSYAKTLKDEELWGLAFVAAGLRHGAVTATPESEWQKAPKALRDPLRQAGVSLALLSRSSDGELKTWLKEKAGLPESQVAAALTLLRQTAPYVKDLPRTAAVTPEDEDEGGEMALTTPDAPPSAGEVATLTKALDRATGNVAEAKARFAAGDAAAAESLLLDGYLEGFEKAESALGVRRGDLVAKVEQQFIAARQAARQGDATAFATQTTLLETSLAESRTELTQGGGLSASGEFLASFVIILREGFEAFLIVGALLTLLVKTGAASAKRWVHAGWVAAILAGVVSYFLFEWLFKISGAARETIEAVCTAAAAAVLFYVSFWLLNQAERSKWEHYIKSSVRSAASGGIAAKTGALFFLSFIAVYREAAETVLFYQALGASAAHAGSIVLGFVAGSAALLVICAAMMRFGVRLPLRRFFVVTSSMMIVIAIVLAGKATNELVEAGFVQPTRISPFPTIDALGIYPNWESLGTQLAAVLLACALAWLSTRGKPQAVRA